MLMSDNRGNLENNEKGTKKERTHREKEDTVFSKIKVACTELSKRKFWKRKYQISKIF